jgi:signal transduction histidine kinase
MLKWLKPQIERIGQWGLHDGLKPYERGRGIVFNYLNFTGLCVGFIRLLIIVVLFRHRFTTAIILLNTLPVMCTLIMIWFMKRRLYVPTVYFSFVFFPTIILTIALLTGDRGIISYLITYMIYPFFFLHRKRKIVVAFCFAAILFVIGFEFEVFKQHDVERIFLLEITSFLGAILLTFVSLFSIKFQVWAYETKIRHQSTELAQVNEALQAQTEKLETSNRVKDKIFSVISHDLKTPLQSLQLLFELEENSQNTVESLLEVLPDVKNELKRTSDLFENLLHWARVQMREAKLHPEPVDVARIAANVTESLAHRAEQKGINLSNLVAENIIFADGSVVEIVLRNLLSNAIKFCRRGDWITLTGDRTDDKFILRVTDTGVGMSAETQARINDQRFYSTLGTGQEKGTGMGLVICRDLVSRSNGELFMESETGRGTVASIVLPTAQRLEVAV